MVSRYIELSLLRTKHREKGLKCLFERSGLLIDQGGDYHRLFQQFRYYSSMLWEMGIIYSAYREAQRDGWSRMLDHSAFLCMIVIFTGVVWTSLYHNQDGIISLLESRDQIRKKCRILYWEEEEAAKEEDNAWRYSDILWNFGSIYVILVYHIIPCYLDYLVCIVYPSASSLRVTLPFQVFLDPLGERNLANFAFSNVVIIFDAFTIIAYIGFQTLFIFAIMDARNEIRFIQRKLSILKEGISTSLDNGNQSNLPENELLMRNVILHHQLLQEYLDNINETFGFVMAAQRFIFTFCFCFNTYSVTTGNKPPRQLFQDACGNCFRALVFFALCRLGESLATQMEELRKEVYDLPWWNCDVVFMKNTLMILRQTSNASYISYRGLCVLNLEAFQETLNTTYSLYMMLKTLTE